MAKVVELPHDTVQHDKPSDSQSQQEIVSDEEEQTSAPDSPPNPCIFTACSLQDLPPEIIVEIVFLAQATDPHVHITISHVDASRRALVKSTPLLWSQIDYLYPLHMVDLYLERSANVPLRVTMLPPLYNDTTYHAVLQDFKEDEKNRVKQFMRAVRPHRHRILSLRLRCDDLAFDIPGENDGQMPAHEFLCDGSMVMLELLDVELGSWRWEGMKEVLASDCIKELHLHGPWTKCCTPLFSTSLKSLIISNHSAPFIRIFDALQASPSLISLTLRDMLFTRIDPKKGPTLTFDCLESLSLIRTVHSAAEALFSCIVAPKLVSVVLHLVDTLHLVEDPTDINQLQLFPAPQPSVQRLDLIAFETEAFFLDSVFRTFPCITHLRIASSNLWDKHLYPLLVRESNLRESPSPEAACLNLKHLTIDNEFNDITSVILEIADFRHSMGMALESVTLRGIPLDGDMCEDILKLREIIPQFEIGGFYRELDLYGDPDDDNDRENESETSSEGDWASGDEEVAIAYRKYGEPIQGLQGEA